MCEAIYDHYHEIAFKWPTTEEEWKEVVQGFSNKWNFHHCCGCIDDKHVTMQVPPHSGSLFYNYIGFYSIVILALVDVNYKFIYVNVGAYGADSDAGVYHDLEQDETGLPPSEPLVGGEAFALRCIVVDDAATFQERTDSSTAHLQLQVVHGL